MIDTPATEPTPTPLTPSTLDDAAIDELILSTANTEWCKVAILIARTVDAAKAQGIDLPSSAIVARIYVLADSKALATQGNVRRWRACEVRLGTG
jgi:Protein of unknown function